MKPIRGLIAQHPFLTGMAEEHLNILSHYAQELVFEDHDYIFHQGDTANRFYLINSGRVQVSSGSLPDGLIEIETLGTGDVLGWSWLIEPHTWQFNAQAAGPVRAIFFYGTPLLAQCEEHPALGFELMRRMAAITVRRLQKIREKLLVQSGTAS
jgi:CRP-like cAMP-binding protein